MTLSKVVEAVVDGDVDGARRGFTECPELSGCEPTAQLLTIAAAICASQSMSMDHLIESNHMDVLRQLFVGAASTEESAETQTPVLILAINPDRGLRRRKFSKRESLFRNMLLPGE